MGLRYALGEIRKHGSDPTWWRKRFLTHVVGRYYAVRGNDGATPVVAEDWDNLVVLDACRYDLFAEVHREYGLPGRLERRTSRETGTPGFLAENFDDERFHDVVYVTANPYVETELSADQFHAVDHVWRDGWDEDAQTVMPDTVRERALAAADRYPDKRLVVHFMQPHAPFVGDVRLGDRGSFAIREAALGNEDADRAGTRTPFEMLETGEATREEVWRAYRSNLEAAIPAVESLLAEIRGRTAVTSDHGNALGEYAGPFPVRVYGHPLGVYIPALTEVPYLVSENGDRKRVVAEPPVTDEGEDEGVTEDVSERLRDLGYAE